MKLLVSFGIAAFLSTSALAQDWVPHSAIRAYKECNYRAAGRMASQPEDAVALGRIAARMCPKEVNMLIDGLRARKSAEFTLRNVERLQKDQADLNAAFIIELRIKAREKESK